MLRTQGEGNQEFSGTQQPTILEDFFARSQVCSLEDTTGETESPSQRRGASERGQVPNDKVRQEPSESRDVISRVAEK